MESDCLMSARRLFQSALQPAGQTGALYVLFWLTISDLIQPTFVQLFFILLCRTSISLCQRAYEPIGSCFLVAVACSRSRNAGMSPRLLTLLRNTARFTVSGGDQPNQHSVSCFGKGLRVTGVHLSEKNKVSSVCFVFNEMFTSFCLPTLGGSTSKSHYSNRQWEILSTFHNCCLFSLNDVKLFVWL